MTDGATTHTVALTDITGLPDVGVGQDHDGSRTITCRIDADRSVDAVLPVAFLTQVAQASEQVAPPPDHFGAAGSAQPPKADASVDEDVHPTPAETTPPSLTASTRRGPTRWQVAGRVGNSLLVFILLGSLVYVRKTSNDQTDRANQAEATLAATDAELTQTKESLDERTNDLSDSNEENADLTARVSELSNEKAEVQDERNAALSAAAQYLLGEITPTTAGSEIGRRVAALEDAKSAGRAVALLAIEDGASEYRVHKDLGITRRTLRLLSLIHISEPTRPY